MKISLYNSVFDNKSTETIDILDFLGSIKFGKWQDLVLAVRNERNPDKQKALKNKLPNVMTSGIFEAPTNNGLRDHSGFIAIDFDEIENMEQARQMLTGDKFTFAMGTSVRGYGLFCLVKIDRDKHRASFRQLAQYYRSTYGLIADHSGINEARRRFVSYDPDIFINEKSARFVAKKEKKDKPQRPFISVRNNSDRIIRELIDGSHNITEDYNDWVRVGMALKHEYGDSGLPMWIGLSQLSSKYKAGQCERKWPTFSTDGRVTFSTIAWMAAGCGIEIKDQRTEELERFVSHNGAKRDEKASVTARVLGISEPTNEEWQAIERMPQDTEDEAPAKVSKVVAAKIWMEKNLNLWRCELTGRVYNGNRELNDSIVNTIWLQLAKAGIDITVANCWAICTEEGTPIRNEIREWLEQVRTPGTDEIKKLVESIEFKHPEISRQLCFTWLLSTLQTLFAKPLPYMMVFTGRQNSGKTEFFRRLLPDDLSHWMAESTLDQGKDSEKLMCEHWLILNDEYKGSTLQDVAKLKDMLSKNTFTLRLPYGRGNQQFRRISSLCGTSNENSLIYDHTGNRRIFPLEVVSINFAQLNSVDRCRMWGQLYNAWIGNEFTIELDAGMIQQLNELSDEYTEFSILYHVLDENYTASERHWTSMSNIHAFCSDYLKKDRITTNSIGREATRLGWVKGRKRINGKLIQGYHVERANLTTNPDENLPF